jgi:hypothetical protein
MVLDRRVVAIKHQIKSSSPVQNAHSHYIYDAPLPSFEQSSTDVSFNYFLTVSLDEVVAAMKALLDKSCTLNPLQTKLLKAAVDVI